MEEIKNNFIQNTHKMEKYLEKMNSKDLKTLNETLDKIKNKLTYLSNPNINDNDYFINQFSQKLINLILSADRDSMFPLFEFYLNLMIENLENLKLIPFFKKIIKIFNKKEQFYLYKEERNLQNDLLVKYLFKKKSKFKTYNLEPNFYLNLKIGSLVDYLYFQLDNDKT